MAILSTIIGTIMQRGMRSSVGRTFRGSSCTNDKLDVFWVQVMLNNMLTTGDIPTLTADDGVPINGVIKLAEAASSAGPTVRAIYALQVYKLKHRKPSGQIHPNDATHDLLTSWKKPISPEVSFNALQASALSSSEWGDSTRDIQMKAVLDIIVNNANCDDQYLHRGIVRAFLENQAGATLDPSSLLRVLRDKFDKKPTISPDNWVKVLRTVYTDEILKGLIQIGAPGTNENGTHPWKSSPTISNKKELVEWLKAKATNPNSIYYPLRSNIGVESTLGQIQTLDEAE